jgi:hypothetical protein
MRPHIAARPGTLVVADSTRRQIGTADRSRIMYGLPALWQDRADRRKGPRDDRDHRALQPQPLCQRPQPPLSRMGPARGIAGRLRARLYLECPGVQRARPASPGPLSCPRPRCPRAWGERLVAGRSLRLRRSGRRRGGVREPSVAATHRSDRAESGITRHRSAARKEDSSGATPAILLNARRTQTSQAVSLESVFPGE